MNLKGDDEEEDSNAVKKFLDWCRKAGLIKLLFMILFIHFSIFSQCDCFIKEREPAFSPSGKD